MPCLKWTWTILQNRAVNVQVSDTTMLIVVKMSGQKLLR